MCGKAVPQYVQHLFRVAVDQAPQHAENFRKVALFYRGKNRVFQRIVHNPVQFLTVQIVPALAVGNFIVRFFPHFADQKGAAVGIFHAGADPFDKIVRKFVRNVQPPAGSAQFLPLCKHAVLPCNKRAERLLFVLYRGQNIDSPPAIVLVRIGSKGIPRKIGRLPALVCADTRIISVFIEINAVVPGVVEHSVQNNRNAALFQRFRHSGKVLFAAEEGVGRTVIARIIAMIACRPENGIEIDRRYAE